MSDHYESWRDSFLIGKHPVKIPDEKIQEIFQRTTQFGSSNGWTGTAGVLSGDCRDLLREREYMLRQIEHMRREFFALGRVYQGVF